jgi:creatinine amidohydrolase
LLSVVNRIEGDVEFKYRWVYWIFGEALLNEEIEIERMTWEEVDEKIKAGITTVVFGVGSIEQHGPVLPLGSDAFIGSYTTLQVARNLGNALVAQIIRPGCSGHHMEFPGTITLRPETLMDLIEDYCLSLAKHGFKRIIVLSTHGGNITMVLQACQRASEKLPDCDIIGLRAADTLYWPEEIGPIGIHHASYNEISYMLHISPQMVRKEKIDQLPDPDKYPRIPQEVKDKEAYMTKKGVKAFSPIGAWHHRGTFRNPKESNPEWGKRLQDGIIKNILKELNLLSSK